jgi:hypothetical protein
MALAALAAGIATGGQARWGSQTVGKLEEKVSRAGVFFRADSPRALRDSRDGYLPLFLEIINGVEKTGHSSLAAAVQKINREPLGFQGVNIFVKPAGTDRQFADTPLRLGASQDFSADFETNGQPLSIPDRWSQTLEIPLAPIEAYLGKHFVGGRFSTIDLRVVIAVAGWPPEETYLRVALHAPPLPEIPNWYRGDVHYHSAYTDNPAERGYPLALTKQAALQEGLRWIVLSDHSTDLDPKRFAEELQDVKHYRDGGFVFIRGEEVTVQSAKDVTLGTLHLIALPSPDDPDIGFPDSSGQSDAVFMTGDGSPGSAAMPLGEVLARTAAAGGFAYAAHPFDPISPLLRGGSWDLDLDFLAPNGKKLRDGLAGLEPWNRATTETADDAHDPFCLHRDADPAACFQPDPQANEYTRLEKAMTAGWFPLLVKGLEAGGKDGEGTPFKVFLAAGSDAHGDLNYEATMDVVDFLSKPSRGVSGYAEDNALGKLATLVHTPEGMGPRGEGVLRALRDGQTILSNGPLLTAGFDGNGNGSLDDPGDIAIGGSAAFPRASFPALELVWATSDEFGPFTSIRLFVGANSGEAPAIEIPLPSGKSLASGGLVPVDLGPYLTKLGTGWGYVRLEARTKNAAGEEFRCYTNPIWVRVTAP